MEVIATILTLVLIACIIGIAVALFKIAVIEQDHVNLYGLIKARGDIDANTFVNISRCIHNKSHFTPCSSCGFWHPYKYIRHLYLRHQFNREWNNDREQIIQDKSNERRRAQSS